MILSFHPIIEADENIICAGREPDGDDLAAIERAEAVILPQGCSEALYRMARYNCAHVFPNLDVRFDFPGKRGQAKLFEKLGMSHPKTVCFGSVAEFYATAWQPSFPSVVKLDWGGQGETVFKLSHARELADVLKRVAAYESSGQTGFLIQQFIPGGQRALRVVVIGAYTASYWRVQPEGRVFGTSVSDGAQIDHDADPEMQRAAADITRRFCALSGLQLAGFDYIFDERVSGVDPPHPLVLEINYFFGRDGLGGSEAYYRLFTTQVNTWLEDLGLRRLNG